MGSLSPEAPPKGSGASHGRGCWVPERPSTGPPASNGCGEQWYWNTWAVRLPEQGGLLLSCRGMSWNDLGIFLIIKLILKTTIPFWRPLFQLVLNILKFFSFLFILVHQESISDMWTFIYKKLPQPKNHIFPLIDGVKPTPILQNSK